MNRPRWLASPLSGTVAVLVGLSLLAIPLRHLTSAPRHLAAPPSTAPPGTLHTVLRLRLLAPANRLTVTTTTGVTLLDQRNLPAGESEHDAMIPWDATAIDLTLMAEFPTTCATTAVFLTLMPDGYEDQTRYGIGHPHIDESLRYAWLTH